MQLLIKQKVFSFRNRFKVYNENNEVIYSVEGKFFSVGNKLKIYDANKQEVCFIKQRIFHILPRYDIIIGGNKVATIKRNFTLFSHRYEILGTDYVAEGDIFAHNYNVSSSTKIAMVVSKKWLSWGDTYVLDILDETDVPFMLAILITIDCVMASIQKNRNN